MKTLAAVALLLVATPFLHAQSNNPDSNFRIEIQTDGDGKPSFSITNLFNDTLTACVIRFSLSSNPTWHSQLDWDTVVQDIPVNRAGTEHPIEAGASKTMFLSHAVGESLPDKVEVVAAIWADGESFGDPKWVNVILNGRASLTLAYDDAIGILQKGLDENWTRDQYLEAVNSKPGVTGPISAIRSTLRGNRIFDEKPQLLKHAVQNLKADFEQRLELLRKAKPAFDGW
jgi:hypothetical protein